MRPRPAPLDEFDDSVWSGTKQRNWLLVGLIASLVLHAILCAYLYRTQIIPPDTAVKAADVDAMFNLKKIDLKELERPSMDQTAQAAKPEPDQTEVQLPDEKRSFDKLLEEIHASTAMPDDTKDVLPDNPRVDQSSATSIMNEIERSTAQVLANNPNAKREQSLLQDSATSGRPQPALTGTELATSTTIKKPNVINKIPGDSAGPDRGRAPGLSDLDSLLSQKGPLGSGTAIRMPSDPLYEYDSADLQPGAMTELQKLATLIKRNPAARFTIEGYSDSFGTPEYNLMLSQRRADSVAAYLVNVLGVNPAQVQARGFGSTKMIVQPRAYNPNDPMSLDAEIARQKPNRRVIVTVNTDVR